MAHLLLICPLKMVIFHSYVKLPEGIEKVTSNLRPTDEMILLQGTVLCGSEAPRKCLWNLYSYFIPMFLGFPPFWKNMWQDISMRIPEEFVDNDLFEMIRDEGGDQVRAGGREKSHIFWRNPGRKRHFQPKFARYKWYPGRVRNTFVWDGYLRILNLSSTTALNIHTQNPEMV